MKRHRALGVGFALLLTLLLPIEAFASMPRCTAGALSETQTQTQHHCPQGTKLHHHDCGGCFCGGSAVTLASIPWAAPVPPSPALWDIPALSSPLISPERLDRPPRILPA